MPRVRGLHFQHRGSRYGATNPSHVSQSTNTPTITSTSSQTDSASDETSTSKSTRNSSAGQSEMPAQLLCHPNTNRIKSSRRRRKLKQKNMPGIMNKDRPVDDRLGARSPTQESNGLKNITTKESIFNNIDELKKSISKKATQHVKHYASNKPSITADGSTSSRLNQEGQANVGGCHLEANNNDHSMSIASSPQPITQSTSTRPVSIESTEIKSVGTKKLEKGCTDSQRYPNSENPSIRSKVLAMEKQIQDLEVEKITLSMAKTPLEAKLRQQEDQWAKEKTRYEQEIYALKSSNNEVNAQLKSLEIQHEQLHEDNEKLRVEATQQKAATTLEFRNKELQYDHDVVQYKEKLSHAEKDIKSLQCEKLSVEAESNTVSNELKRLRREYQELKVDYNDIQKQKESYRCKLLVMEKKFNAEISIPTNLASMGNLANTESVQNTTSPTRSHEYRDTKQNKRLLGTNYTTTPTSNSHKKLRSASKTGDSLQRVESAEKSNEAHTSLHAIPSTPVKTNNDIQPSRHCNGRHGGLKSSLKNKYSMDHTERSPPPIHRKNIRSACKSGDSLHLIKSKELKPKRWIKATRKYKGKITIHLDL